MTQSLAPSIARAIRPSNDAGDDTQAALGAVVAFETKFIGRLLDGGFHLVAPELKDGRGQHFEGGTQRLLFRAMCAVADRGESPEMETITLELTSSNNLRSITFDSYRGADALRAIEAFASTHRVDPHNDSKWILQKYKERWAEKRLREAAERVRIGEDPADVVDRVSLDFGKTFADEEPKRPAIVSLGSIVERMASAGPVTRLCTGIASFDAASCGGIESQRFWVLAGAPGTGKTGLAANQGHRYAKMGIPVAFLAIDEGEEGIVYRIAQAEGIPSHLLDAGDADAWARAREIIAKLPIYIAADDSTIEEAAAALRAAHPNGPAVLVVDSLQKARCRSIAPYESERTRIDGNTNACKGVVREHALLVIATSEVARGSYRSKNPGERIDDLAAAKESGGIEYAAQTLIVLRSVPADQCPEDAADHESFVDANVVKHRRYHKLVFRLCLDHRTATFAEVPMPEEESKPNRQSEISQEILNVVRKHGVIPSKRKFREYVKGRVQDVNSLVDEHVAEGRLVFLEGDGYRLAGISGVNS